MPSSYTISLRLTLQATGENNNTWGAILNSGVFGLVDYAVAGVLAFTLSGTKNLTSALGATDEARAAFLDITGGAGGDIVLPPVSKGYFVRNASAGPVVLNAGGPTATFAPGDAGPVFTDGAAVYPILIGGLPVGTFITNNNQTLIDYVNLAISQASISLPPATIPNVGYALMVRMVGADAAWVPSQIQIADVAGAEAAFVESSVFWALYF